MMMMMSVERRGGVGWDEGEERTNERGIREDDKEAREREHRGQNQQEGREEKGARKERRRRRRRRGGVMGDKPRWNSDDAKFGKRRRLLCVCVCVCVCVYVRRLAESAAVPVSRL